MTVIEKSQPTGSQQVLFCLFVLRFYGPVNPNWQVLSALLNLLVIHSDSRSSFQPFAITFLRQGGPKVHDKGTVT